MIERILSVIILSNTNCDAIYEMNINCLNSLAESELWDDFSYEVILMESNGRAQYRYDNISNSSGGGRSESSSQRSNLIFTDSLTLD